MILLKLSLPQILMFAPLHPSIHSNCTQAQRADDPCFEKVAKAAVPLQNAGTSPSAQFFRLLHVQLGNADSKSILLAGGDAALQPIADSLAWTSSACVWRSSSAAAAAIC